MSSSNTYNIITTQQYTPTKYGISKGVHTHTYRHISKYLCMFRASHLSVLLHITLVADQNLVNGHISVL